MLQLIYELRKNCCGTDGRKEKSKVLQEVLADLKRRRKRRRRRRKRSRRKIVADGREGSSPT